MVLANYKHLLGDSSRSALRLHALDDFAIGGSILTGAPPCQ